MSIDRRSFLAASAAAAGHPSCLHAQTTALTPEQFGARGDGVTNDTPAFARLSAEVNRRGGGTISLRAGRTYLVGAQTRGRDNFGWGPEPILQLERLNAPLKILGNGARLRCRPGLRAGTFDLQSDLPVQHPMPYTGRSDLAGPYEAMILVQNCRASVEVRDLELDGNVQRLRIGGQFGDRGWQVPGNGLMLVRNSGSEIVDNVYSHHHAKDGATFIGDPARSARSSISRLICRYNGRQGGQHHRRAWLRLRRLRIQPYRTRFACEPAGCRARHRGRGRKADPRLDLHAL